MENIDSKICTDFDYELGDSEFHKCWALSNLRPYSAKKNQHDGVTKIRHKKEPNEKR